MSRKAESLFCLLTLAVIALAILPAQAQRSLERARKIAGDASQDHQCLKLGKLPREKGKAISLFDGHSLNGWEPWLGYENPALTYVSPKIEPIGTGRDTSADFGVARIDGKNAIHVTGRIWGSLMHRDDLRDYHLRLEFRWGNATFAPREKAPRNNGLLYHSHGRPGQVFGTWRPSVELEILERSIGMMVAVGPTIYAKSTAGFDPSIAAPHLRYRAGGRTIEVFGGTPIWNVEAATDAERPLGSWNVLDLYVLGNRAIHVVNGVPVAEIDDISTVAADGSRTPLTHGKIQLQSEGAETWFRSITVRPISTLPEVVASSCESPDRR